MRQRGNKSFQEMLTRAKTGLLNNDNLVLFNNKVTTIMPIWDLLKNIVVVQ